MTSIRFVCVLSDMTHRDIFSSLWDEEQLAEDVTVCHSLLRGPSVAQRKHGIHDRLERALGEQLQEGLELCACAHHGAEDGKLP